MSDLGMTFDANEVEERQPLDVIPSGKYKAAIVDSDIRTTKDGTSKYLWLEFQILEGDCAGRKLWDRLCLWHDNEQTRKIALEALGAICRSTGKMQITDAEELHDIPLVLSVRVRKPKDGYDESNEIRGYAAVGGAAASAAKADGRAPAPTAKRAGNPWDED